MTIQGGFPGGYQSAFLYPSKEPCPENLSPAPFKKPRKILPEKPSQKLSQKSPKKPSRKVVPKSPPEKPSLKALPKSPPLSPSGRPPKNVIPGEEN